MNTSYVVHAWYISCSHIDENLCGGANHGIKGWLCHDQRTRQLSFVLLVAVIVLRARSRTILNYLSNKNRKLNGRKDVDYPRYSTILLEEAET